jgi:5-formyltetrahydrofolate cyclo-ligase
VDIGYLKGSSLMSEAHQSKAEIRKLLSQRLAAMTPESRHAKSVIACELISHSDEFRSARNIMLFLSMPQEVDTASLALRAWQSEKTVIVPTVSWEQRRILPVEISSLQTNMRVTGLGVREPVAGKPVPIDLIGHGMGFYDRFLAQEGFVGLACGFGFEEQVLAELPVLDHDMPLDMLVTDWGVRRFTPQHVHS